MSRSEEASTNTDRAVAFFRQPVWEHLLGAVYTKYMARGRIGGQVVLTACTDEERREIARFLKKRLPAQGEMVIRLSDFQQALNESSFACDIPTLLRALFPERPHLTRPEQRELRASAQQRFYEALSMLAAELPDDSKGKYWLLYGTHGREALFRRYKNESPATQEQLLRAVGIIVAALAQLPVPSAFERLALFAQHISGDPHCFDTSTLTGRLFLQALLDLRKRDQTDFALVNGETSGEETGTQSLEQDHERLHLYYEAGLLVDTISSNVAVFHLTAAKDGSGRPDPLLEQAGERVLILPLRQLLAWERLKAASQHVYLFENPQVFEVIVDQLQNTNRADGRAKKLPTLICTSGWLSIAAIRLLNLLVASSPEIILHYSGDFDIQGLRIAAHLLARYAHHCHLWRFDAPSYLAALHNGGTTLSDDDIASLQRLPDDFAPLVATMQARGQKAYQEGLTQLLLQDIQQALPL